MRNHETNPERGETTREAARVRVTYDYPVVFTRGVFDPDNAALRDVLAADAPAGRTAVFLDAGLAEATPGLRDDVVNYAGAHGLPLAGEPLVVPGGEAVKDGWRHVHALIDIIQKHRLCRHSHVLAAGGGAFLDAVGFAAALVHRGVRLVRLPSTTLAMGDSGVGVKNGINLEGQKNLIGAFAPPWAVVNDLAFLDTLPRDVRLDGIAEAFKVALIKDAAFFDRLDADADALGRGEAEAVARAVRRSAAIHLDHIRNGGDPFERGEGRPLDFGHWAAHRLEAMSGYVLRHGQAVAVGIAVDVAYAAREGLLDPAARDRIHRALARCGLPLWHPLLEKEAPDGRPAVLEGIEQFREHLGGRLSIAMPRGIGACVEVNRIDPSRMIHAIGDLRAHAPAGLA